MFHSFDVIHAKPAPGWLTTSFGSPVISTLAVEGKDYIAYIADGREVDDAGAGDPLSGEVAFTLPAGRYSVRLFSPQTGLYSPAWRVEGGRRISLDLAPFRHDVALRVTAY